MQYIREKNIIGVTLFYIGIFIIGFFFIAGLILANHASFFDNSSSLYVLIETWVIGFIIGMLFIGFSEVIKLLQNIYHVQPSVEEKQTSADGVWIVEEHKVDDQQLVKELGKAKTDSIYHLYDIQNKTIEEIIITPFNKQLVAKVRGLEDVESYYEVITTSGNDAINSSIEKHPHIKEWLSKK
ncbi:hypothetical protein [Evansella cellulosilytica]|uniref:Uncharacterized protein n=1 Tax=Evansella cellulosilytica (strain ATCC 21833 / DSM 2522 / FERM P-1141 / JCM 9156 / N-4) TaxID=649639 RepID=E6TRZ3_EVAC2|nr:hypothetical protein [Evansella cellulosilytica]ADU30647.1 hypothetical protein Bcell_2389 [Evansella cellulosilytica DSM 2522]